MVFLGVVCAILLGINLWRIEHMNQKLTDAIAALQAETTDTTGKLASIKTFILGIPALVGAAVADALANNDVDEEAAAAAVSEATQTVSDATDDALSAIDANPGPEDAGSVAADEPGVDSADTGSADAGSESVAEDSDASVGDPVEDPTAGNDEPE